MIIKSLMRCSLGLSWPLSMVSSASCTPCTQTQTMHRLLLLASSPVVSLYCSRGKYGKSEEIKDVRGSNGANKWYLVNLNSEDIKDLNSGDTEKNKEKEGDLTKIKEDWEEEGVTCEHCDIGFTTEKDLCNHTDLTGKKGGGGCKVLWNLKNKTDVNAGILKHVCDFDGCDVGFKWKSQLERHKAGHSEARPFVCTECGNSYKLKQDLNKHVRQKHSGQVFECPECDKTFNSKGDMKIHLKICRQEEKEFKCNQCGNKFHTNSSLTRHIKQVHAKERPHKCDQCDYSCSTKRDLKRHMLGVHEKAKPHQCEDCSSSFSTARSLKVHRIAKHTFDWPHICHVCEERGIVKGYITPGEVKKHMKAQHPLEHQEQLEREKPAVCHVCEKRFKNEEHVKIHVKKKHNQL